ncbi:MAG: response regulator [Thermodesulfobacteriota bacterium]
MDRSSRGRILYMEDDRGLARLFQKRLQRAGFDVEIAFSGEEGMRKYDSGCYDIVFVDQQMTGFTGLDVLRALAGSASSPAVVMVTGFGNETLAVEAMKLGAIDYLIKDTSGKFLDLIPSVAEHALEKRRLQQAKEKAEAETRAAKAQWERTFDAVPDLIMILSRDFRVVRANRAMADRLGVSAEELEGRICYELVHATPMPPSACPHALSMRLGTRQEAEVLEANLGGEFAVTCAPLFDERGTLTGSVHVARDVTDRRRAQEAMVHKERFDAISELATGVAHHFNNLLQIVVGSAHLAKGRLEHGDLEAARNRMDAILECARLGSETVKRLQRFAGLRGGSTTQGRGRVFDVSETVQQAVELSRVWWQTIPEKDGISIKVTTVLEPGCWFDGQESEIFEVVLNLLRNAVEALPMGGEIRVDTAVEGNASCIRVTDNGVGIAEADLPRIYDPFFTTKGFHRTGMGLSSAFGVISRCGGTLSVESREGQGTCFTATLPLAASRSEGAHAGYREASGKCCVLLIDDLLPVLTTVERNLQLHGYETLTALSGEDGIELFESNPVDLVICDLGMPHMNGWEVGKRILHICQDRQTAKPPFILLTGWAGQISEEDKIVEAGVDRIVEKPLGINELLEVMGQLRAGRPGKPE